MRNFIGLDANPQCKYYSKLMTRVAYECNQLLLPDSVITTSCACDGAMVVCRAGF